MGWRLWLGLLVLAGLLAVGGGSNGCGRKVPSRPNRVNPMDARSHPISKAGTDQTVAVGMSVALDGSGSTSPSSASLRYHWASPLGVTLSDTTAARPTFTAPTSAGDYRFVLVVSEGSLASVADTVRVTVRNRPVAVAGPDQAVGAGMPVCLDGSGSSAPLGAVVQYHWTSPDGVTLSDATSARPTFTAPSLAGEYRIGLVVRDEVSSSESDEVVVVVWDRPVAVAGVDQTVAVGMAVALDGSGSSAPSGGVLRYHWISPARVTLSDTTAARPTFTAPSLAGEYRIGLVVSDGLSASERSEVLVTVKSRPVAAAGADQTVAAGTAVTLDGSGSSASSGGVLRYHWMSPVGVTLSDTTAARPTFMAPSLAGEYRIGLVVRDGLSASERDEVLVAVKSPPVAAAGADQTVAVGMSVALDGTGSMASSGGMLHYHWTVPADVTLSDTTAARPTFTALAAGDYRFSLVVSDGLSSSVSDEVVVTVKNALDPGEVRRFTLASGVAMEFVWIPPGTFTMGSPSTEPGWYVTEGPQHEVTISRGFWLGRTEVTQGQWEGVMGTTPWLGQKYVQSNTGHPAVYISWEDVQGLLDRLNQSSWAGVYRFPTEGEWEYACRAGSTARWSFGGDESQLGDYAWYAANAWNAGKRYGQPVGMKLPNPWGLYDMHGNVFEWCQDRWGWDSYSSDAQTDPQGPAMGSGRVVRGGSFYYDARCTRSAYRDYSIGRDGFIGARLLRAP